jgi:hypothetical protein
LIEGDDAVDAAMAAALVQGVVDRPTCGITGFGSWETAHRLFITPQLKQRRQHTDMYRPLRVSR